MTKDAYKEMKTDIDYDPVMTHSNDKKKAMVMHITSNDKEMHIGAFEELLKAQLGRVLDEDNCNVLVKKLIKSVKKDKRLRTHKWEFSVQLEGPEFSELIIQIYPTYQSWSHLRKGKVGQNTTPVDIYEGKIDE